MEFPTAFSHQFLIYLQYLVNASQNYASYNQYFEPFHNFRNSSVNNINDYSQDYNKNLHLNKYQENPQLLIDNTHILNLNNKFKEENKNTLEIKNQENSLKFVQEYGYQPFKKNRNLKSNIFIYFISYLKDQRMQKIFYEVIVKNKLNIEKQELLLLIKENIKPKNHYCNCKYFYQLLHGKTCSQLFSRFLRITFKYFLKNDMNLFLRKAPKMRRTSKIMYLRESKIMLRTIFEKNNPKYIKYKGTK